MRASPHTASRPLWKTSTEDIIHRPGLPSKEFATRDWLLNGCKPNVIRVMPPLTVSLDEIDEGVERFEKALVIVYARSGDSP